MNPPEHEPATDADINTNIKKLIDYNTEIIQNTCDNIDKIKDRNATIEQLCDLRRKNNKLCALLVKENEVVFEKNKIKTQYSTPFLIMIIIMFAPMAYYTLKLSEQIAMEPRGYYLAGVIAGPAFMFATISISGIMNLCGVHVEYFYYPENHQKPN